MIANSQITSIDDSVVSLNPYTPYINAGMPCCYEDRKVFRKINEILAAESVEPDKETGFFYSGNTWLQICKNDNLTEKVQSVSNLFFSLMNHAFPTKSINWGVDEKQDEDSIRLRVAKSLFPKSSLLCELVEKFAIISGRLEHCTVTVHLSDNKAVDNVVRLTIEGLRTFGKHMIPSILSHFETYRLSRKDQA